MPTYPTSPRSAFLTWCQAHAPVWAANAAQLGLEVAQTTAYTTSVTAAAAANLAQEQAKQAAQAATVGASDAFGELRGTTGDMVRAIRNFAEQQADPNSVYIIAEIPPPGKPSPAPPPAQPTDLTVELNSSSGELTLRWKASNPVGTTGTAYIVRRKLPGEPVFGFIGVTGVKKFIDDSLFAGPDSVQYTVQGQRADAEGPVSQVFTVNFGRLPEGGVTAFVSGGGEASAPKLAA